VILFDDNFLKLAVNKLSGDKIREILRPESVLGRRLVVLALDYLNWLKGEWVMTPSQLHSRQKAGYVFPKDVKVVKSKDDKSTPEDRFRPEDFPDFVPGKFVNGEFQKIIIKEDHNLAVFQENILSRNQNNSHCGKVVKDPEVNCSFDQSYEFSDGPDDQSDTCY
jgi:hypothetical protein